MNKDLWASFGSSLEHASRSADYVPARPGFKDNKQTLNKTVELETDGDETPVSPEVHLWRSFITQMFQDACYTGSVPEEVEAQIEAKNWLITWGEDFNLVCDLAEINSGFLITQVHLLINRKWRLM